MKKIILLGALTLSFILPAHNASAVIPVSATYSYTGSPGNYLLDFTFANNIPAGDLQYVYFVGVDLPLDGAQGSPAGWISYPTPPWNNFIQLGGGSSINYNTNWVIANNDYSISGIGSGASKSGFTVHNATVPSSLSFFAFGYDDGLGAGYSGTDAFVDNGAHNPGFEGLASLNGALPGDAAVIPEPCSMMLFGTGLLGFIRRRQRTV